MSGCVGKRANASAATIEPDQMSTIGWSMIATPPPSAA
jgi:hypothetical protein